jgi:hypothetical protein
MNILAGFGLLLFIFHFTTVAGRGGQASCFEQADSPEIFVETEFFFVGHFQK